MMAGFTILEPFLMASPAPMKWPKNARHRADQAEDEEDLAA